MPRWACLSAVRVSSLLLSESLARRRTLLSAVSEIRFRVL